MIEKRLVAVSRPRIAFISSISNSKSKMSKFCAILASQDAAHGRKPIAIHAPLFGVAP
jgi:hypothetical protein